MICFQCPNKRKAGKHRSESLETSVLFICLFVCFKFEHFFLIRCGEMGSLCPDINTTAAKATPSSPTVGVGEAFDKLIFFLLVVTRCKAMGIIQ